MHLYLPALSALLIISNSPVFADWNLWRGSCGSLHFGSNKDVITRNGQSPPCTGLQFTAPRGSENFFTARNPCNVGQNLNYYQTNSGWDVFIANGDGKKKASCYPQGNSVDCKEQDFSCHYTRFLWCQSSLCDK